MQSSYTPFMSHTLASLAKKVRPSVVRVFVHDEDVGNPVAGTGFFIDAHTVLTCAHTVLLTTNILSLLEEHGVEKEKDVFLKNFFMEKVRKVEIQKDDGTMETVIDVRFDGASDVAILTVTSSNPFATLSTDEPMEGSDVFYCGYPKDFEMPKKEWPFSVLRGTVSSKVRGQVGGYKENMLLQIQTGMLGGASGAPLFSMEDGGLVGFMNGYRTWGTDGLMRKDNEEDDAVMDSLYVPLPLAVATPIENALVIAKKLAKD